MPKCKKCGESYEVLGEDDGLCPACCFDQLLEDGDVEIYTIDQVAAGALEGRLGP